MKNLESIFNPADIIAESIAAAGVGALFGGIRGSVGKCGLSFFNPALASTAGTFFTFAGVGAIALPLAMIPMKIKKLLLENSTFLSDKPVLKQFIDLTSSALIVLTSVTAAATILGTPLGTTLLCMMMLPLTIDTLALLATGLQACLKTCSPTEDHTLCATI